ncbi:MAG: LON peptidase substrate-binding domain-containing protein, partial [candidate division Zixibacteria bacterium]
MIIETKQNIPVIGSEREEVYPLMALRSGVLFPGTNLSIQVVREENMALINYCHSKPTNFVAAFSPAPISKAKSGNISVHQIGVLAKICDVRQGPGEYKTITIEGFERV